MSLTIALVYLISVIGFFILVILHERKTQHIGQEELVMITVGSILWPICLVLMVLVEFYRWLEKVVNK